MWEDGMAYIYAETLRSGQWRRPGREASQTVPERGSRHAQLGLPSCQRNARGATLCRVSLGAYVGREERRPLWASVGTAHCGRLRLHLRAARARRRRAAGPGARLASLFSYVLSISFSPKSSCQRAPPQRTGCPRWQVCGGAAGARGTPGGALRPPPGETSVIAPTRTDRSQPPHGPHTPTARTARPSGPHAPRLWPPSSPRTSRLGEAVAAPSQR